MRWMLTGLANQALYAHNRYLIVVLLRSNSRVDREILPARSKPLPISIMEVTEVAAKLLLNTCALNSHTCSPLLIISPICVITNTLPYLPSAAAHIQIMCLVQQKQPTINRLLCKLHVKTKPVISHAAALFSYLFRHSPCSPHSRKKHNSTIKPDQVIAHSDRLPPNGNVVRPSQQRRQASGRALKIVM